jgi:general secretion pathway protein G
MSLSTRRRGRRAGFTLVELMLVVIIIGILAAMVVPSLVGRSEQARLNAAKSDIRGTLGMQLDLFEQDTGAYPTTEQGLDALIKAPEGVSGWRGSYLKEDAVPLDPWGRAYVYKCPGDHEPLPYDLASYGRDGKEGGGDDIANYSTE